MYLGDRREERESEVEPVRSLKSALQSVASCCSGSCVFNRDSFILGFPDEQACACNLVTGLCVIGVRQRQNSIYIDELSLNKWIRAKDV